MNAATNPNPQRALIYCRVSTKEQAEEGSSLATQERACRDYAGTHGFEVAAVFVEHGESAKTADRTELQKLLLRCADKAGGVAAVIVHKLDRLSRNTDDYSQIRLLLRRHGVEIRSASEHFEDTPAGRFLENIIANVAQFDNDVRAERCAGGMREAVRDGRYVWLAPIGYVNVRVAGKATIAPSEMAPLVRRAFELVARGTCSPVEVWRLTKEEGLKHRGGKPVCRAYFHELLRNALYTGWIEKFGERHRGRFEPIVSEPLFGQVQRVLDNQGRRTGPYKADNPDFPLRRFVFHPSGRKLTGSWSTGRSGKYPYYHFSGAGGSYRRDALDESFRDYMNTFRLQPEHIDKLRRLVERKAAAQTDGRQAEKRLRSRLHELEQRQTALVQKNLSGVISDAVLQRHMAATDGEIAQAQALLAAEPADDALSDRAIGRCERYLREPGSVWAEAGLSSKRRLQWFQFPSGVVLDGEKFGTGDLSFVFRAKEALSSPLSALVDYGVVFWNPFIESCQELAGILSDRENGEHGADNVLEFRLADGAARQRDGDMPARHKKTAA